MPTFAYTAIDVNSGREKKGAADGPSEAQVTTDLKALGLYPTSLKSTAGTDESTVKKTAQPKAKYMPKADRRQISLPGFGPNMAKTRMLFTRQLATLVKAGMPILRGLEVLSRQQKPGEFKTTITSIAETIRSGGSLSDGLAQHPRMFDRLYLNMVKAGEASGALDVVLQRLAEFLEKAHKIRGKVKSAMTYPLIIMTVAVSVVGALVVFVVPKFESIFATMLKGQPLPPLTQSVLSVSRFVQGNIGATVAIGFAIVIGLRFALRTSLGSRWWDRAQLILPVLGDLVLKGAVARFTRTLGTLLASGVQILQALQITRDTAGNVHVAEAVDRIHARVKSGESVARPLEESAVFPAMVASMVEVGEETGKLPDMLERIADTYDEEVDNAVAALTSILEPIMIVIMALMVGTVVIALFLPLVRIVQTLS
ncbi:type II secretion system F family protein [Synoicihabitans lomoniglobus]|uniref:General secretion pathway protein F n=1 Tax=Synoicihabitans lomoniglobus TaxID=2909285 RepID=A0AAF0I5B4_9BACT|nr:type II secretion system F family protein [Opitutaceae bacterium LMO-M01]WED67199.1 type II secretion system F family protein [Opitutaceae bacterium LMO-M01]